MTAPSGALTRRTSRGRGAAQKVRFSITIPTATVMAAAGSADIAATIITVLAGMDASLMGSDGSSGARGARAGLVGSGY
jgi:hypothetical protein